MRPLAIVLCAALAACAARPEPSRVPAAGRYAYTAAYALPGTAAAGELSGVLVIAEATEARVTGRWEVPGFMPEVQLGAWVPDAGAYQADADVSAGELLGTFRHRIARDGAATRLRCAAELVRRVDGRGAQFPARCTLRYLGP